jgi:glutamate--cysteine ligase
MTSQIDVSPAGIPAKSLLATQIYQNLEKLEKWFFLKAENLPLPFYASVDLRDAGFKLAPVDCNLYPAGFNNLCEEDRKAASPIIKRQIENWSRREEYPAIQKILILPESHTSNAFYSENLFYLREILEKAGFETKIGWYALENDVSEKIILETVTGAVLEAFPIQVDDQILHAGGFTPDLILLNNDFSSGFPERLREVKQPILPTYKLGWHSRRKNHFFEHYNQLVKEFSELIEIDPWLLQVESKVIQPVNFDKDEGLEEVAKEVDLLLARLSEQYQKRGIQRTPFAIVKSNAGTYGMGVMSVRSGQDLLSLNRRKKHKMTVGKGRTQINSILVQEGIPTSVRLDELPAEPVIYLAEGDLIGGFIRTNTLKNEEENLNAKGMVFKKLCTSDLQRLLKEKWSENSEIPLPVQERLLELIYGSIARLSALATGMEIREHIRNS